MTQQVEVPQGPLAVPASEFDQFGCPGCGGIYGTSPISGGGTAQFNCSDCGRMTLVVADDLDRSAIGISSGDADPVYPVVVAHPRRGRPINREQLMRERQSRIMDGATSALYQWLRLGFGREVEFNRVSEHTSKSQRLPILASSDPTDNVEVTWFGYNYHSHFLGLTLRRPLPATLMYPISSVFGHYALSGHVNTTVAPPVDFLTAYYGKKELDRFGTDTGDGFSAALVIRYLRELSRLDIDRIMDVCFGNTRYGARDEVDANAIDKKLLFQALGLRVDKTPYQPSVAEIDQDVFDGIMVSLYEGPVNSRSAVRLWLAEGTYLPPMPLPRNTLYVNVDDTLINVAGGDDDGPLRSHFGHRGPSLVPVSLLNIVPSELYRQHREELDRSTVPVSDVYHCTSTPTREFVFGVANVLDAALTAFFLTKVVAPAIQEMRLQA